MNFDQQVLAHTNDSRRKHGVVPLKLNEELSKLCQDHADHLLELGRLEPSEGHDFGENLYYHFFKDGTRRLSGDVPVKSWYDEICFFMFGREPSNTKASHFTQMVWKETKQMGVGVAHKAGMWFVVAMYYPKGNTTGNFVVNVLPPLPGGMVNQTFIEGKEDKEPENALTLGTSKHSTYPKPATQHWRFQNFFTALCCMGKAFVMTSDDFKN